MLAIHRGSHKPLRDEPKSPNEASLSCRILSAIGDGVSAKIPPSQDVPLIVVSIAAALRAELLLNGKAMPLPAREVRDEATGHPCVRSLCIAMDSLTHSDAPPEVRRLGSLFQAWSSDRGDFQLVIQARPWTLPCSPQDLTKPGFRTVLLSLCGEHQGTWYDGPIAHLLPDGSVASFIPSGGSATLLIPESLPSTIHGVSPTDALALEDRHGLRAHRCLLARIDHYLTTHRSQAYFLDSYSLKALCLLVLMRQARPDTDLKVYLPDALYGSLSGPWRRFGQNVSVVWAREKKGETEALLAPLPVQLIPDEWSVYLSHSINKRSDVIPRSLLGC